MIEQIHPDTTAVTTQAILQHLYHEAGTLVRISEEEFAFTRFANRTFPAELVNSLIDQGWLLKIKPTYRTPNRKEFYSISNAGIKAIGGVELFGTAEIASELRMRPWEIDELTTLHKKLNPIGRIIGRDWRIYGRYSIKEYLGCLEDGDTNPELKLLKVSAVAKVTGQSIHTVQKHILQRLLYGKSLSGKVMVFTKTQVANYIVWLQTRASYRQRVRL
ncbi:hypothetical protein MNBD_CHLOROFLEXI01-2893 [hydrothermal vent metagenome]|uniref:Uncharacterized protein n=1 Tax=hydrothermal vent metagenome TaxID=652676 RepID=A0A3B0VHT7_9ZZZZ